MGEMVRERRKALGLTQQELADLITPRLTAGMIGHIESGIRPVSPEVAIALERVLGIPKEKLVFGDVA